MSFLPSILAAAVAFTALSPGVAAWSQQQAPDPGSKPTEIPRSELFMGFSYLRGAPSLTPGNRLSGLYGGSASYAFNLTRSVGLVTDLSGFRDTEIGLIGPGALPNRVVGSSGSVYSLMFGPRFSYRKHERFTPFLQVLGGGIYATKVTLNTCLATTCTPLPEQGSVAVAAGGGFDIKLTRRLAYRPIQAEYLLTRFADATSGVRSNQNDLRLSSGIVFRFGSMGRPVVPPPPSNRSPVVSCTAASESVPFGSTDLVAFHAVASDPDGDPLTYDWSSSSGSINGTNADASWNPAGAAPGIYTVHLLVHDGRGGEGHCSSNIEVVAAAPIHVSLACVAAPSVSVRAGQRVQITATPNPQQVDTPSFTWHADRGTVTGSGSAVQFDTTGLPDGSYAVSGSIRTVHNGEATCATTVDVVDVVPLSLHSIYFETARPTEQNPDGGLLESQEATLVSLAGSFSVYLRSHPDAYLTLEGHTDPRGSEVFNQKLSERRVQRTLAFLTGKGIASEHVHTKAFGKEQELTEADVRKGIETSQYLSDDQRAKELANIRVVMLASNRRVDIVLSTNGDRSNRTYPFNAADSFSLLSEHGPAAAALPRTLKATGSKAKK